MAMTEMNYPLSGGGSGDYEIEYFTKSMGSGAMTVTTTKKAKGVVMAYSGSGGVQEVSSIDGQDGNVARFNGQLPAQSGWTSNVTYSDNSITFSAGVGSNVTWKGHILY